MSIKTTNGHSLLCSSDLSQLLYNSYLEFRNFDLKLEKTSFFKFISDQGLYKPLWLFSRLKPLRTKRGQTVYYLSSTSQISISIYVYLIKTRTRLRSKRYCTTFKLSFRNHIVLKVYALYERKKKQFEMKKSPS